MLSTPPTVHGNFEHASTGQVASLSTAVVHLYLESMEVGHAPVAAIQSSIQPYFPEGGYKFSQLPFDIANPASLATYITAASELSSSLAPFLEFYSFLPLPLMKIEGIFLLEKLMESW